MQVVPRDFDGYSEAVRTQVVRTGSQDSRKHADGGQCACYRHCEEDELDE